MPTNRIKLATGTVAALLMFGTGAHAQSDLASRAQARIIAGVQKLEAGCAADAKKFCANVTPGEGRLFFCIRAYEDQVSPKCDYALFEASRNLDRALNKIEDAADACWSDIEKLCANVSEGGGRIAACLTAKKASVSQACQAAVTSLTAK